MCIQYQGQALLSKMPYSPAVDTYHGIALVQPGGEVRRKIVLIVERRQHMI